MRGLRVPAWFVVVALIVLLANALATLATTGTIELMRGMSEFASAVRKRDLVLLNGYLVAATLVEGAVVIAYLLPLVRFFADVGRSASTVVRRRARNAPAAIGLIGFAPWLASALFFPAMTLAHFGRWSGELMSQQVLSPLVNGFLAATTSYLLVDLVFQRMVTPRVFPEGDLTQVEGSIAPGVSLRLLIFLLAVAFAPLFTMLGLVRAAAVRFAAGIPAAEVVPHLTSGTLVTFFLYGTLGVCLTLVVARIITRPLVEMAAGLRRVAAGDLEVTVRVTSDDELGVLETGVNSLVAALRDREHILRTFGHVVEPSVRDHLLSGDLRPGGELREASVLFCDLRGYTAIAERTPPAEMVATLNEFFTVMTAWVRECGGFVDKFVGDAMLVVFGLFDRDRSSTRRRSAGDGLRCAIGMRGKLGALNAERTAAGRTPLRIAIGFDAGEVLAGTLGAEDRHEYTVIGDTVNVAQRLQELCRELGRDLLVTEAAYELARESGFAPEAAERMSVPLRGRSEPVRVVAVA
jgi:adenylate cyclase